MLCQIKASYIAGDTCIWLLFDWL